MGPMGWVYSIVFSTLLRGDREDLRAAEGLCLTLRPSSDVTCVVVRASDLNDSPGTGDYVVAPAHRNVGVSVAREDVATFMLSLLTNSEYDGRAVSIGSTNGVERLLADRSAQRKPAELPTRQGEVKASESLEVDTRVLGLERELAALSKQLSELKVGSETQPLVSQSDTVHTDINTGLQRGGAADAGAGVGLDFATDKANAKCAHVGSDGEEHAGTRSTASTSSPVFAGSAQPPAPPVHVKASHRAANRIQLRTKRKTKYAKPRADPLLEDGIGGAGGVYDSFPTPWKQGPVGCNRY